MKTQTVKFLMAALILLSTMAVKAEYSKTYHKAWAVNKVKALSLESKFSNINFVNNRDDSVTIDVLVKYEAASLPNQIDFIFSLNDGTVKAKTDFSERFKSNSDFSITYTINIPNDRSLNVENKFGNVTMGDLNANGIFDIKYGNIYGQNLKAPANEKIHLDLKYGDANFQSINRLMAELGYGKLTAGDIDESEFDTQYSIVKCENTGTMKVASKYDQYAIESVKEIKVESKFTNWNINTLHKLLAIETQYGDIRIDHVTKGFDLIKIENSYGNIKIGINPDASYELNSDCYYCNISFPEADVLKRIEDNNHTTIKAIVGKANPTSKVNIDSKYGKVKLNQ